MRAIGASGARRRTPAPPPAPTTWNPEDAAPGLTIDGGGLAITVPNAGGNSLNARASEFTSSAKWYFEGRATSAGKDIGFGVADATASLTADTVGEGHSVSCIALGAFSLGGVSLPGGWDFGGPFCAVGEWLGVAVDPGAGTIWFRDSAGWVGDPAAGTGGWSLAGLGASISPFFTGRNGTGSAGEANFGASAFAYAVPSGFAAVGG